MNDGGYEDSASRLAELLKHPDDLDKLPSLRSEFTRKKAALDSQLKHGLKEQLEVTQHGMSSITDGQKIVQAIKEEMMKIDRLCAEAQGMIKDFSGINRMSIMQRNFSTVEAMKASIDSFGDRIAELEQLLREDEMDLENQPNLLAIHAGLSELRDVRDRAMDQVKGAEGESGMELIENLPLDTGVTLRDYFTKLDDIIEQFDEHVGQACINIISLVQAGNNGLVVRLALIIEEEEKKDKRVKALQDAEREFQDVASRFKSMQVGHRELRGYKKKFLQAVEYNAQAMFDGEVKQEFLEDPERLDKACKWFFNDLNAVKLGMQDLMPKKWKIFKTFTNIYHKLMHDFLVGQLDDKDIAPVHMLAILNWVGKYYNKMSRLGFSESELVPNVIDSREPELVRDYRSLITKAVEEWMDRMAKTDKQQFLARADVLDQDHEGHLHTKSIGDTWTMLREQLAVAQSSGRPDVVEGVIEAMYVALRQRLRMWERLLDDEARKFEAGQLGQEAVSSFHDWLVAIANDQITNIDDDPIQGATSYLSRFKVDYEPMVTPAFLATSGPEHEALSNAYVDLSTHCLTLFAKTIFNVDFKSILAELFTQNWYSKQYVAQMISTFDDYLNDYTAVFHPSLREILIEELADELLVRYLGAVKNKGVKFRRQDAFTQQMRTDIKAVVDFFKNYPDTYEQVREKWRAAGLFERLLSAAKGQEVIEVYEQIKLTYWDVQIGWVEAVLRARDDFDRSMLVSVKTKAAEITVERGPETVMGKIR